MVISYKAESTLPKTISQAGDFSCNATVSPVMSYPRGRELGSDNRQRVCERMNEWMNEWMNE